MNLISLHAYIRKNLMIIATLFIIMNNKKKKTLFIYKLQMISF